MLFLTELHIVARISMFRTASCFGNCESPACTLELLNNYTIASFIKLQCCGSLSNFTWQMLKAVLVFRFLLHVSCGLQDPRGSNSHYYIDLMTQDVDGDLELSMQPDATPSSGGKGASKRDSNYSQEEDIQLCKSWISISFI